MKTRLAGAPAVVKKTNVSKQGFGLAFSFC
jgi:hypothetical protein